MTAKELLIRELEEALEEWDEECEETRNKGAVTINELKRLINLTEAGELKTVIHALTHELNPVWTQFNEYDREVMYTRAQMIKFAVEAMERGAVLKLVAVAHGSDGTDGDSMFDAGEEWVVEYIEGDTLQHLRPRFRTSLLMARPDFPADELLEEIEAITGFWVLTTEEYEQTKLPWIAYSEAGGGGDSEDYVITCVTKAMAREFHLARGGKNAETSE